MWRIGNVFKYASWSCFLDLFSLVGQTNFWWDRHEQSETTWVAKPNHPSPSMFQINCSLAWLTRAQNIVTTSNNFKRRNIRSPNQHKCLAKTASWKGDTGWDNDRDILRCLLASSQSWWRPPNKMSHIKQRPQTRSLWVCWCLWLFVGQVCIMCVWCIMFVGLWVCRHLHICGWGQLLCSSSSPTPTPTHTHTHPHHRPLTHITTSLVWKHLTRMCRYLCNTSQQFSARWQFTKPTDFFENNSGWHLSLSLGNISTQFPSVSLESCFSSSVICSFAMFAQIVFWEWFPQRFCRLYFENDLC